MKPIVPFDFNICSYQSPASLISPYYTRSFFNNLRQNPFSPTESIVNLYDTILSAQKYFEDDSYIVAQKASTDTADMRKMEEILAEKFKKDTPFFISILKYVDFEDGYSNNAIEFVSKKFEESPFVASVWLGNVFNQCYVGAEFNNIGRNELLFGILRIVAYLNDKEYFGHIQENLSNLVLLGLKEDDTSIQDAALMVIENWRDEKSFDMLNSVDFSQSILKNYAEKLKSELKTELSL